MTQIANPFRPTRWEHHRDGRPLLWFTDAAGELAAPKSVFLYGSRGSGKTSLLKSICWEDLADNDSLRLQRRLNDFDHIGIYIRACRHLGDSHAAETSIHRRSANRELTDEPPFPS